MLCVLDRAGLEESQKSGFRKITTVVSKRLNEAIGISKEDCTVNVIRTATEWN